MTVPETNEVAPPMGELESEKLTFDKLLFMKLDSLFLLLFISPFTYYTYRRFINEYTLLSCWRAFQIPWHHNVWAVHYGTGYGLVEV